MNQDASEAEIVDNYRLDHLYTHAFKDGSGKFFTVVSPDEGRERWSPKTRGRFATRSRPR